MLSKGLFYGIVKKIGKVPQFYGSFQKYEMLPGCDF